jgi:hypothetical protein
LELGITSTSPIRRWILQFDAAEEDQDRRGRFKRDTVPEEEISPDTP